MDPLHDPAAFAELAADLQSDADADVTAHTIVDRLAELVPDADHVSLTLRQRGQHRTLAASDTVAEEADGLQYHLGEGPCLDAAQDEPWVRSRDVALDRRWPSWGPKAAELGVGAMLSVRLLRDDRPQGALNMYCASDDGFRDRDTVDVALVYAIHAANALTAARLVTDLHTAVSSRHTIGMAQGILIERYGLTADSSFELLRRLSSTHETKLRDLAEVVVRTGKLPPS